MSSPIKKTNVNRLFFYRYPLEENVRENEAEDQRCLAQVEEILEAKNKGPVPCVGIIVEPIQSEGGDHHGSPAWFQGLQVNFYQIMFFCQSCQISEGIFKTVPSPYN